MDVTVSQAQGRVPVTIFHITGAVTDNRDLEARAQAAYDGGARNILLDLTEVPYMATAGLRALAEFACAGGVEGGWLRHVSGDSPRCSPSRRFLLAHGHRATEARTAVRVAAAG